MPWGDKEARTAYNRAYYAANRPALLARNRAWRVRQGIKPRALTRDLDPSLRLAALLINEARKRAKRRGIKFTLSPSDITIPEYCPALGLKLERSQRPGGADNSPSLDRIVPALGYVKGNVRVISARANRIKADATADEIEAVARWLRTVIGGKQ